MSGSASQRLPEGTRLAYIVSREAWYSRVPGASARRPDINVMASAGGGGVAWEFTVEEVEIGSETAIRVKVFDDAFAAFTQIPEFFTRLAAGQVTTLDDVRELLACMGAADETQRRDPDAPHAGYREEPGIPRFGADPSDQGETS